MTEAGILLCGFPRCTFGAKHRDPESRYDQRAAPQGSHAPRPED